MSHSNTGTPATIEADGAQAQSGQLRRKRQVTIKTLKIGDPRYEENVIRQLFEHLSSPPTSKSGRPLTPYDRLELRLKQLSGSGRDVKVKLLIGDGKLKGYWVGGSDKFERADPNTVIQSVAPNSQEQGENRVRTGKDQKSPDRV